MKINFHESRTRTIFRVVEEYLGSTSDSFQTFSARVVEYYDSSVSSKSIEFSNHEDTYKRIELNAQKIKRFMSDEASSPRFPAELEESFVKALPDEYRLHLLSRLAARYELIATPMPKGSKTDPVTDCSKLLKQVGSTLETIAPIMADGKVDANDLPYVNEALTQLYKLLAQTHGWVATLKDLKTIRVVKNVG